MGAHGHGEREGAAHAHAHRARSDRALLAAWVVAAFVVSALRDLRALAVAAALALGAALLLGGAGRAARRTATTVLPLSAGLSAASAAWLRLAGGAWPDPAPFAAVVLRSAVIAFATFAVLGRVDLLRAAAPSPTATRLLVLTLAQIHALRLLATESALGLRSRLLRRPTATDAVRGAGGVTAALLTMSMRNARDVADAMRSRGF
jgi:cobalt/nickel transport system permease protein